MAQLVLNGVEIPLAPDKAELGNEEIGSRERADDGSMMLSRKADKLTGDFETTWMPAAEASALRGMLLGRGDLWRFDGATVTEMVYSGKQRYPNSAPTVTRRDEAAVILGSKSWSPRRTQSATECLVAEEGTTNLLSAAVSRVDSASYFGVIGSVTLTRSTATEPFDGVASLRIQPSAGSSGASLSISGLTDAEPYTISFYIRGAGAGVNVAYSIEFVSDAASLNDTGWRRIEIPFVASGTTATLQILPSAEAFVSALQLEHKQFATSWVLGSTSRGDGSLLYRLGEHKAPDDLTVMCWARTSRIGGTDIGTPLWIFDTNDLSRTVIFCVLSDGTTSKAQVVMNIESVSMLESGTFSDSRDWHHYAVTIRRTDQTTAERCIYVNGSLAGSDTIDLTSMSFGSTAPYFGAGAFDLGGEAQAWNGAIDDLIVLPYAVTADYVASVVDDGWREPPIIDAAGDGLFGFNSEPVPVVGTLGKIAQTMGAIDGEWQPVRKVSFTLTEK